MDEETQKWKNLYIQLNNYTRANRIYDLRMEIDYSIINFDQCSICYRLYDELYPSNKIAIVADCLCVLCKDCLRNWFNKSEKCTNRVKFCPLCLGVVNFANDYRIHKKSNC